MEAIIAALALVVSTLIDLPNYISQNKKSKLGKSIYEFYNDLNLIIKQGYVILDKIEILANAKHPQVFQKDSIELYELVEHQTHLLEEAGGKLVHSFFWDNIEMRGEIENLLLKKTSNVQKVLSIYEPNFGSSIKSILWAKKNLLRTLGERLLVNINTFEFQKMQINEITNIKNESYLLARNNYYNNELIKSCHSLSLAEDLGIGVITINLNNLSQRTEYLSRERHRLKELENGCNKLAEMMRQHFEPHEII